MNRVHISRIDLNLLVVFDTVFSQASITRAADVLNLSQPAVSHAVKRLRELYDDPLFVRQGKSMQPSPLARRIRPSVQRSLQTLQATWQGNLAFDPGQSRQTITLGMREVAEATLVPSLVRNLQQLAPGVQLSVVQVPRRDIAVELAAGRIDLAVDVLLPLGMHVKQQKLLEDEYVVLARPGHPALTKTLSLEDYLAAGHVAVSSRASGMAIEDFELSRQGLQRRVAMRCQHFLAARATVAQTDLLLTLPARYASQAALRQRLKVFAMPVRLSPLAIHLYWHVSMEADPANQWLREQVWQVVN